MCVCPRTEVTTTTTDTPGTTPWLLCNVPWSLAKQTGSVTKEPIEVPYTSFTRAADDANSFNTGSWYQVKSAYRDYYWNAGTSSLQPTTNVGNNDGKDKSSDYESTFFQPVSVGDGTYYLQTRDGRYLYVSNGDAVQLSNYDRTPFKIKKSNGAWRIYRVYTTGWILRTTYYDYIDAYSGSSIHHTKVEYSGYWDWSIRSKLGLESLCGDIRNGHGDRNRRAHYL